MSHRIIHQGPGYTIAASDEFGTMTHYGSVERPDGNMNHGFVDLKDRPDLIDSIAEAGKSVALGNLLRLVNAVGSPLMSIGCECGLFELAAPRPTGETYQVGGYIDITFRDGSSNNSESALIDAAEAIMQRIPPPPDGIAVCYEMIVQQLKLFFGSTGHFGVMIKPLGYGHTPEKAWQAFECATAGVETSLRELDTEAARSRPG